MTCISLLRYHFLSLSPDFDSSNSYVDIGEHQRVLPAITGIKDFDSKRLDIACCGIGHRIKTMAKAARDFNQSVHVNWGPCSNNSANIFADMFKPTSAFIPYKPSEGDIPFPKMRDLAKAGVKNWDNNIPKEVQSALVDLLVNNLSDQYMKKVNKFKEDVQWDSAPIIGLHIRTGNTPDAIVSRELTQIQRRVGGRLQENIGLENWLYLLMSNALALAKQMGTANNFRVLVVTDSNVVIDSLKNMTGIPNWFHRPQTYFDVAHPLVYGNLLLDNAGESCQRDWFSDPIIDLHLLASSEALLTSMKSSFYHVAEVAHLINERPVCHCAQNHETPQSCQCIGDDDILDLFNANDVMLRVTAR